MSGPSPLERRFLFLQGPPGGFFRDLARVLRVRGHRVDRVNFNGGDRLDWGQGAVNHRRGETGWPSLLVRLLSARAITDVVLFGDCRPIHRTARAVSAGLGLTVHVFEEGYIRPDWVTVERGGVNGFSALPSNPQWYRDKARGLARPAERPPLPSAIRRRGWASIRYYLATVLAGPAYPGYRTHRPWSAALEALGWARKTLLKRRVVGDPAAVLKQTPYFLLPLQLDSDYQLREHSTYGGVQPALAQILTSFARHASPFSRLVVKEHPLDNGLRDWRHRTMDQAQALGVDDRVVFLRDGDIDALVRAAQGVVTVNSTTGALALAAGVPVITLGKAVYDIPGLTHQGSLDEFWRGAERPDRGLYDAFRRVLAAHCLLWGGFYATESRDSLLQDAADRLLAPPNVFVTGETTISTFPDPRMIAAE